MSDRRRLGVLLLGLLVAAGGSLAAQEHASVFIAFGDSITRGGQEFDEENRGGYPGRLQGKLRQDDPDAVVHNFGRDGETTAEGLSRVDNALQTPAEAFLLMEGTNDVNRVIDGLISFESIESNLAAMANRADNAGLTVYLGTLWVRPPQANRDRNNTLTFAVTREIRDLAFRQQRDLVDIFDIVFFTPNAFNTIYDPDSKTGVGHPNAAGFTVMANAFYDVVRGIDSQGPVPGELIPGYNEDEVAPGDLIELTIHDFGAGIDAENTTLTINGDPIETDQVGSERRRTLAHIATAESLGCYARLGIRSADLADPPNVSDHFYTEYRVVGGQILVGDLNRSCRVDGADLLIITFAFGARSGDPRYSKLADVTGDGVIDGRDLAELASNFGRSS